MVNEIAPGPKTKRKQQDRKKYVSSGRYRDAKTKSLFYRSQGQAQQAFRSRILENWLNYSGWTAVNSSNVQNNTRNVQNEPLADFRNFCSIS